MNRTDENKTIILSEMPSRVPTNGTFELTIRCNLHCKMCLFRHDDSENAEIKSKELTADQWIDLARQVAEAGTLQLLITGGEPLLRPDFCEIWEGIYKQGFIISLYTNATLVTPRVMECLKKYPPHKIGVTIYGANPETYKKVTGSASAYRKAMEGINLLRTLPSTIEYRMTVIRDNYPDIEAVESLVEKEFCSKTSLVTTRIVTKAVRGGCANVEACRLSPEKNIEISLKRTITKIKKAVGDAFLDGHIKINYDNACQDDNEDLRASLFGCNAGMKSYTVSWDGKLLACQMMEPYAKELCGDFLKTWDNYVYGINVPSIPSKCQNCEVGDFCSLCPAVRYSETGSFSKIPTYICEDTRAVYQLINKYSKNPIIYKETNNESICET